MTKYNARKVEYDGIKFDSKMECRRYMQLKEMESNGQIKDLRIHVPFELIPTLRRKDGSLFKAVTKYTCDFMYYNCMTNETVVEDVKGFVTDVYALKEKMMFHKYGIEIKRITKV